MNHRQKQLSVRLLAMATLLAVAPMQVAFAKGTHAPKAPALGAASAFAVLGDSVTCTNGQITGNVGAGIAYTNTTCPVVGKTPPATDGALAKANSDFLRTYDALLLRSTSCVDVPGNLADLKLSPGVYCLDSVAKTGALTLTGSSKGVWIFLVEGALAATDFTVTMAGGGQACNVWWAPTAGTTMTTSAIKGNILAGDVVDGAITLTGGTLVGRALANIDVTTTDAVVTRPAGGRDCPK